jgi:hypothetical protein
MRRTGIGVIVGVLLVVGGCARSGDDALGLDGPPPLPPPEPLVSLDSFTAAGVRAVRTQPEADRDLHFDTRADTPPVVAAGGSLVALTTDSEGGPVPTKPDGALLAAAVRQPDGRVVVGTQGRDDARLVLTADGGATWQVAECPATFRPAGSPRCEVPRDAGGRLWLRGADVSLDAGRTWTPVTVGASSVPRVDNAVGLPGGGWLGSAVTLPAPTTRAGLLVRSTDGVAWQPVVEYPCEAGQGATVSPPRPLGDRWLVTYTCVDGTDTPQRSHLYLVDRDGTQGRVLVTVDRPGAWLGTPVAVGGAVVVPEVRGRGPVTFLQLRV